MPALAAWTLLVTCTLVGVVWGLRTWLPSDAHGHWRDEPRAFAGAWANAALLGVGTGMLAWFVLLVIAEVVKRLVS
jgi:hypothetical protein